MTNRTCPIGYHTCFKCNHRREVNDCAYQEGNFDLALQQASQRALIEIERLPRSEPTLLFSGASKASELQYMMLQAVLGDWYDKGYRLVMGEDIVTLFYAGYDDVVFVFGREVREMIPAIKQACYLHALRRRTNNGE